MRKYRLPQIGNNALTHAHHQIKTGPGRACQQH
jgi:hypothetical protein